MTLTTSLRNVAVGLVIATGNFAGSPAVTAVLAYGVFEIVGSLVLALSWVKAFTPTPAHTQSSLRGRSREYARPWVMRAIDSAMWHRHATDESVR